MRSSPPYSIIKTAFTAGMLAMIPLASHGAQDDRWLLPAFRCEPPPSGTAPIPPGPTMSLMSLLERKSEPKKKPVSENELLIKAAFDNTDWLLGDRGKRIKKRKPGSLDLCYRYVKTALLKAGIASHYLSGVSAKNAGPSLKHLGYVNTLKKSKKPIDPRSAPRGAILVYSGGQHGHIEIKTGKKGAGGFVSDYSSDVPITEIPELGGPQKNLIGIYVRR